MEHIIYIPGLGDHFDLPRRLTLAGWRRSDTRVTFVPMRWNDRHETYEAKYDRVAKAIKQAKGSEVTLVGESAGGAMALFVFSRNLSRVSQVITICGYNHGAADVHLYHKRRHPAFYQLMPVVDDIVAKLTRDSRGRLTTIYSVRDHVVTPRHSRIDGAKERVLHTPGHFISIVSRLLRGPTF
jgi:hypothetical protein